MTWCRTGPMIHGTDYISLCCWLIRRWLIRRIFVWFWIRVSKFGVLSVSAGPNSSSFRFRWGFQIHHPFCIDFFVFWNWKDSELSPTKRNRKEPNYSITKLKGLRIWPRLIPKGIQIQPPTKVLKINTPAQTDMQDQWYMGPRSINDIMFPFPMIRRVSHNNESIGLNVKTWWRDPIASP